jgi:uncharacterized protein (DUF1330 family)
MPIEPDASQLASIGGAAGGPGDGPVVMLNLNRYRARAAYEEAPPGGADADVSGHEAYERYGAVAGRVLAELGGRILWFTTAEETVIGDESDRYDEVIAVWYPSRASFVELATGPEILAALPHRRAGLERAALICCGAGDDATLTGL